MTKLKRIGVLTSGGDCGGLNAVIRAIFLRAKKKYNIEVYGICLLYTSDAADE